MHALPAADTGTSAHGWRLAVLAALVLGEVFLTSYAFNFPTSLSPWANPVAYAKDAVHGGVLALIVFAIVAWPQRSALSRAWREAAGSHNWRASIALNLGLFAALLAASVAFSSLAARATEPPWHWFALYCGLLVATAASLALVAAPASYWRWLMRTAPTKIWVALLSAGLLVLAGKLSQESWGALSGATLHLSHAILTLYETDVVLDAQRQLLGAGGFKVLITQECSGYEGIGMVVAFLALYSWLMRRELRFPHALLLFPIAIATVWLLNTLRIAALISIGRHVSSEMAVNGFHSQAGWIGFLAVGIGVMVASRRLAFFRARPRAPARSAPDANEQMLLALLVPFMALMATSIVASMFAPHDQWLYVLKVAAVGAALWAFRHVYARLPASVSPLSVVVGLGVGLAWVATDAPDEAGASLSSWLVTLPAWAAALWMACRALGAVILVPMAEELAFRGYFLRVLISRNVFSVAPGKFTWLSFIATSVLFGLMHQRWAAAALAGAIYALLLYRTNRISDPIAAHMATNAVIVAWAIAVQQWSLL